MHSGEEIERKERERRTQCGILRRERERGGRDGENETTAQYAHETEREENEEARGGTLIYTFKH